MYANSTSGFVCVSVCVCVCMCVRMCVCMCVCLCVCVCAATTHAYCCAYMFAFVRLYANTIRLFVFVCVCVCTCMCVCAYKLNVVHDLVVTVTCDVCVHVSFPCTLECIFDECCTVCVCVCEAHMFAIKHVSNW